MPASVSWLLTAAFTALAWTPLTHLWRGVTAWPADTAGRRGSPVEVHRGQASPPAAGSSLPAVGSSLPANAAPSLRSPTRADSVAELVLCAAMIAMTSPVGAPIPAAGWQAVLLLTLGWSLTTRRLHHLAPTATMLFMLTAMPHPADGHGPWLTMPAMGHGWWTPFTFGAAAWFLLDAAHSVPAWHTDPARALSRTGMSLGMACALVGSA
ncbi:DUF5134 domain-containing protein [Amycolatopsis carbonis]|uniref:DUF5134 domain-containing protein n=1 Tax=Amycolatopsis carbonis TaxID=715471 RepID=A0A9Y2INH3_9PSEU|nr:DUF5134 domain-containing protein [Amycolatopsis sp. 2-15]WIX81858.1 DUF5134 domain-containing protein [Amycolatopsis sp. 2-15]